MYRGGRVGGGGGCAEFCPWGIILPRFFLSMGEESGKIHNLIISVSFSFLKI